MTTRTTRTARATPTRSRTAPRRRAPAVVAVAVGVVLTLGGLALAAASSALAAPKLTLSSSTVTAGQTVTVTGSGFPAEPTSIYITICANPPNATNCDVDLAHVTQVQYDGGGSFRTTYQVAVTTFATADRTIDCATTPCVIGSTNALAPKDHSYNAVAPITVGGSAKPSTTPTPTTTQRTPTQSGSSGTKGATEASALPKTGGSDAGSTAPLLGAAGVAGLLAGLVLVLLPEPQRRGRHAR